MSSETREILVGATTALVIAVVFAVASGRSGRVAAAPETYTLEAMFQRSDGLTVGAPVRLAGLQVGRVDGQRLNEHFQAIVTLSLQKGIPIPADSAALIQTDGLVGDKYVEIQPGGEDRMLEPGQRIELTQDSVIVEDLLSKVIGMAKERRGTPPKGQDG